MRLNHEYWCELECTWQTNSINKTTTSDRRDSWASSHWRGIDLVFKSIDCFTVRPIFSTRLITRMKSFSFFLFHLIYLIYFYFGGGGGGVGVCGGGVGWGVGGGGRGGGVLSSIAFSIWCRIPISRPPMVLRRSKRRFCLFYDIDLARVWILQVYTHTSRRI